MALSQGIRARLEAQRLLLKEKLDQLGSEEPPSALNQDPETSTQLPSVAGSAFVSEGGSGWGGMGFFGFPDNMPGSFPDSGCGLIWFSGQWLHFTL